MRIRHRGVNNKITGIVSSFDGTPVLLPTSTKDERFFYIKGRISSAVKLGALVEGQIIRMKLRHIKILKIIEKDIRKKSLNYLTLSEKNMSMSFSTEIIEECQKQRELSKFSSSHKDFTALPFNTVDPPNAMDKDDAVCALEAPKEANCKFLIYIAIADVSYFVAENSQTDIEARKRGNSTYLPGLCIPMLPQKLSSDLCSLVENRIRPCIVVEIKLNSKGEKIDHEFHRAIIKNKKAFTYDDFLSQKNKASSKNSLYKKSLDVLWKTYNLLIKNRFDRSPLELDFPEIAIEIDHLDKVKSIKNVKRTEANLLIEELMVLANTCAAQTLLKNSNDPLFRIHMSSIDEKLGTTGPFKYFNGFLNRNGTLTTKYLNDLIKSATSREERFLIQKDIVNILEQARYSTKKIGHFGLNLDFYTHFTSPIRRYADLIVHRKIIEYLDDKKANRQDHKKINLESICDHISRKERLSAEAEKHAKARYIARHMKDKIGETFSATVIEFKAKIIFLKTDYLNADGIIILRRLGNSMLFINKRSSYLHDRNSNQKIVIGSKISTKLIRANELNGRLTFEYSS